MKIIGEKSDLLIASAAKRVAGVLATDVSGKAMLYFIPLFLTPFADKLGTTLLNGQWPTAPSVVGCMLLGTIAGCIGLRALYDGSYQRDKDERTDNQPPESPAQTKV